MHCFLSYSIVNILNIFNYLQGLTQTQDDTARNTGKTKRSRTTVSSVSPIRQSTIPRIEVKIEMDSVVSLVLTN